MTRVLRCTRIKRRILRPTSLYGASAPTVGQWVPGTPRYGRVGSFILAAFLTASCAFGADGQKQPQQQPASQPPAWRGIFPKPPDEVVRALKITRGQSFEDGYVFINGKYLPPPYRVERYGNIIRINDIQVTPQIVPWAEIAKTQKGFAVRRIGPEPEEAPQAAEEAAEEEKEAESANAAEEQQPQPQPKPHPRRDRLSLEELFGEKPIEPKNETAPKPAARPQQEKPRATPKKTQRSVTEVVTFEGKFIPDDTTAAHLAKMDGIRTNIDSKLRAGGYIFFGSRYPLTSGNASTAKYMVGKLPEIMRRNTSHDAFINDMHRAGLSFLSQKIMDDLFRNRFDFLNLLERAKKQSGRDKWREILDTQR